MTGSHDPDDTTWLRPATLAEALAWRAEYPDAHIVAGGVWVALLVQQGLIRPTHYLVIGHLPELRRIAIADDGTLALGAACSLNAVARAPAVRAGWPALAETYGVVANERIRNQGTVGGNLGEADYASDPPTILVALDAEVRLARRDGVRSLPVREFLVGHYETQIAPDELLVGVRVPALPPRTGARYVKFVSRSSEDRPCAGVAAVVTLDVAGRCARLAVAVGAVASTPVTFPDLTGEAVGAPLTPEVARRLAAGYAERVEPLDDLRGSSAYRRQLLRALIPRAIAQAAARAAAGGGGDG